MKLEGSYFLFGTEDPATTEARESIENLGLERAQNIGYAVPIGEIADAVTVAYFSIQSIAGGDFVGAGLQIFNLLVGWANTKGRPDDVRRCDLVFEDASTGQKTEIRNFEYKTVDEVRSALEAVKG